MYFLQAKLHITAEPTLLDPILSIIRGTHMDNASLSRINDATITTDSLC